MIVLLQDFSVRSCWALDYASRLCNSSWYAPSISEVAHSFFLQASLGGDARAAVMAHQLDSVRQEVSAVACCNENHFGLSGAVPLPGLPG
jgi:hypothetical protein